jgi:hypothetical protein
MSSTNGSAVPSRSGRGLVAIFMALALLASALFASSASAAKPILKPTAYVAIGDSLGFGYTEEKFDLNLPTENPSNFEGSYTNYVAGRLAKKEKGAGNALNLINLSCPGENTEGTIGHNPLLGGGAGAEFNPCAYREIGGFPLHTPFAGASQLEAAIGAVTGPAPVKLVTINMGSNDELAMVGKCAEPAYRTAQGFINLAECLTVEAGPGGHQFAGGLFHHIIANVGDMVGVLRAYGYTGPVGILGFYNPQANLLPGSDSLQKAFNEAFECAAIATTSECTVEPKHKEHIKLKGKELLGPGVVYGNPFPKFNPSNPTLEGERICLFTEECNAFDKKVNLEALVKHPVTVAEAAAYPVGDIHATPLGYTRLGQTLAKALGI